MKRVFYIGDNGKRLEVFKSRAWKDKWTVIEWVDKYFTQDSSGLFKTKEKAYLEVSEIILKRVALLTAELCQCKQSYQDIQKCLKEIKEKNKHVEQD